MAQYVFTMNRVTKTVPPKRQILKQVSLSFFPGAKIGVLGLNGSGKSTVLKIMAGLDKEFEGEAYPMPGIKIGYLPQEPQLNAEQTVREAVEEGVGGVLAAKKRLDEVYAAYADEDADFDALAAEQAELEAIISASGGENTDLQLELAADALRLPPWDAVIGNLSGGEKRRVALCRLLLSKPDMLLLDEPTNHLDAESVEWLEHFLQRFPGTVVAVTHDRYFLDNAAEWPEASRMRTSTDAASVSENANVTGLRRAGFGKALSVPETSGPAALARATGVRTSGRADERPGSPPGMVHEQATRSLSATGRR